MTTTMDSTLMTDPNDFLTARTVGADIQIRRMMQIRQMKAQARALQIQKARMISQRQQGVGVIERQLASLYSRIDHLTAALGAAGVL